MERFLSCMNFSLRKGGARGLFFLFTIALLLCGFATLSYAFTLPDTGQTKCYQGVSPWAEIPCAGTGQDGAYDINPMSYTDNGNGTVTDNNTVLMWQREDDNLTRTWANAITYCDDLNLGGHSDWRLPTKKELISIVDYSIPFPGPTINPIFTNTKQSNYWSSTTYASSPGYAWAVDFGSGYVGYGYKDGLMYVRCVRGG